MNESKAYPPLTMALRIDELESQLAKAVTLMEAARDYLAKYAADTLLGADRLVIRLDDAVRAAKRGQST